jgi:hypothetical protein
MGQLERERCLGNFSVECRILKFSLKKKTGWYSVEWILLAKDRE